MIWVRADGHTRHLVEDWGVPALSEPPRWLEDALCELDRRCPGWGDLIVVAGVLGLICGLLAVALP